MTGSPAIAAADPAVCAEAQVGGVDQRGQPRRPDRCTLVAFEAEPLPPPADMAARPIWQPDRSCAVRAADSPAV